MKTILAKFSEQNPNYNTRTVIKLSQTKSIRIRITSSSHVGDGIIHITLMLQESWADHFLVEHQRSIVFRGPETISEEYCLEHRRKFYDQNS